MICERLPQSHVKAFHGDRCVIRGVRVAFDYTPCHLGGSRRWFLCPGCGRRCAILYPVKCRVCLKLIYASEHEGVLDRRYRAAFKLRERLGQSEGGLAAPFPSKPKLMRWHTYFKLRRKALANEQRILGQIAVIPTGVFGPIRTGAGARHGVLQNDR
jgi:hypothetical protein